MLLIFENNLLVTNTYYYSEVLHFYEKTKETA